MENNYIREWVEHYKSINVDNIIIYDNNDIDGENLKDVIGDYIESGFVIVENCRGKTAYQCTAYGSCFRKYKKDYDWIAFFDADEFLEVDDIKKFLENDVFNKFDCVRIPWKLFDDSGIIECNGDYSIKRFKDFTLSNVCKAIVNTKSARIGGISPHGPLNVNACDPTGIPCASKDLRLWDSVEGKENDVWLNHYMLKTIDEYIHHKMVRLYPDQSKQSAKAKLTIQRFFRFNKVTQEKIDYLKKYNINCDEIHNIE